MKVSSTGRISRRHTSLIVDDKLKASLENSASSPVGEENARAAESTLKQVRSGEAPSDGLKDRVLQYMKELKLPLTRETYLAVAYPQGVPDPLSPEQEARIPPELD